MKIGKSITVTGAARAEVSARIKMRYEKGESIRTIADSIGRSYGFVHGILREIDVPLRRRGGANGSRSARASTKG
jgi:hypothetical protein